MTGTGGQGCPRIDAAQTHSVLLLQRLFRGRAAQTQRLESDAVGLLQLAKQYIGHLEDIIDLCSLTHVAIALKSAVLKSWISRLRHFQNGVTWAQVPKAAHDINSIRHHMRLLSSVCGAPSLRAMVGIISNGAPLCYQTRHMMDDYDGLMHPLGFVKVADNTAVGSRPRRWTNGRSQAAELSGVVIDLRIGKSVYAVHGVLPPDPNHVSMTYMWQSYFLRMLAAQNIGDRDGVGKRFSYRYFDETLLQDMLCMNAGSMTTYIKEGVGRRLTIREMSMDALGAYFTRSDVRRKRDALVLLMIGDASDINRAVVLFSQLEKTDSRVACVLRRYLSTRIRRDIIESSPTKLATGQLVPTKDRVAMLALPESVKRRVLDKVAIAEGSPPDGKAKQYVDGILRIPFQKFRREDIFTLKDSNMTERRFDAIADKAASVARIRRSAFLLRMRSVLDEAVHGQISMKRQLERIMARWITGTMSGAVIGLKGPPGVGKTTIIKKGLAKCWVDASGRTRPFYLVPLGGISSGSTLVGHSYTYVGSTWGRIADIVMSAGCMNPIIFFDELDKVSASPRGEEIISVLTHLTDESQNSTFYDKYFDGVPIDMSKAVLVFSFNDEQKVDPILLDRMTVIEALPLYHQEKIEVVERFALPSLLKNTGYGENDIVLEPGVASMLIQSYTREAGVRKLKQIVVEVIDELNLRRLLRGEPQKWPLTVSMALAREILGARHHEILPPQIGTDSRPGVVHGMYATRLGLGGVLMIEVYPIAGATDIVTGTLGDVMKESVACAKSLAKSLFAVAPTQAVHVHIPEAATPKDGPSAGAALALAIWSCWTKTPLNHRIAITGEVDLSGNIRPVGGLRAKIIGAVRAGMTKVLVPSRNASDIENLFQQAEFSRYVARERVVLIADIDSARAELVLSRPPSPPPKKNIKK